jgi:predicted RNA-binding Zn ribbon-like protein
VPLRLALDRAGDEVRSSFVPHRDDQETVLVTELLSALQTAVLDGRLARLRLCERPECGWCYYDGTKNRSGRWCSSDPCGDVMKTRAFRARQASGPARG